MATPLLLMSSAEDRNPAQPDSKPDPSPPKTRGRKPSKAQKNRQCRRGMGVARLEQLIRQDHHHHHHHDVTPTGFPVHNGPPPVRLSETPTFELPSMPNLHLFHHYSPSLFNKKKWVIGEELGFTREKGDLNILSSSPCNFSGFDHHHYHHNHGIGGGFYPYAAGSEVVAVHKRGSGSGNNVMMEYGFFPGIPEENDQWKNNHNNINYEMATDLNLKMGFSDSCSSCSSSKSSMATEATTTAKRTATSCSDLDLSLKLSY